MGVTSRMSRDHTHFQMFDGLRALAATLVFCLHVWIFAGIGDIAAGVDLVGVEGLRAIGDVMINLGFVGVALFYVISAFLLYRPLYRARVHGHPRPNLRAYLVRRAVRIIPAYWVALTVIGLVDNHSELFTWDGFFGWYCLTFIYRSGSFVWQQVLPAWTICVEASFYLFLPVWSVAASRMGRNSKNQMRVELVLLAVVALASVVWKVIAIHGLHVTDSATRSMVVLPASLDVFAAGMALAVISVHHEDAIRSGQVRKLFRSGSLWWILALTAYGVMCALGDDRSFIGSDTQAHLLVISLMKIPICVAIAIPAVFGAASQEISSGAVSRLLGSRPVQWIGKVSYGLYLWHVFVLIHLTRGEPFGMPAVFPNKGLDWLPLVALVGYSISLAFAALSWRAVERPAMHRGRRLARRIEHRAAAAVGTS